MVTSKLEGRLPGAVECNKRDEEKLPCPCRVEKVELRGMETSRHVETGGEVARECGAQQT